MKLLRHLVWGVLISVSAWPTARVMEPKEVAEKLKFNARNERLKFSFKQVKRLPDLNLELKSEGEMELHRPDEVIWKVLKPSPLTLTMAGKKVSLTTGVGKEARQETWTLGSELDEKASKSLLALLAWLKLDIPVLQEAYRFSDLGNATFLCEPKISSGAFFKFMKLTLDPRGHLSHLHWDELSGDSIELSFSSPTATYLK